MAPDELKNVKGQYQKKIWDVKKGRYVIEKGKPQHEELVKKVQNEKGEWEEVKKKTLYQKWVAKSQQRVAIAGMQDQVDDANARKQLQRQGLNRVQKRILNEKEKIGISASDKMKLQSEMDLKKSKTTRKTKAQKVQEMAKEF